VTDYAEGAEITEHGKRIELGPVIFAGIIISISGGYLTPYF
jgi:hypothetical protein